MSPRRPGDPAERPQEDQRRADPDGRGPAPGAAAEMPGAMPPIAAASPGAAPTVPFPSSQPALDPGAPAGAAEHPAEPRRGREAARAEFGRDKPAATLDTAREGPRATMAGAGMPPPAAAQQPAGRHLPGQPDSRRQDPAAGASEAAAATPESGKSPPFRLEPLRGVAAPAGASLVTATEPGAARDALPRTTTGGRAASADPVATASPPADVRLVASRAELLSVTLSAATAAVRDRLAGASGELRESLARIGTEVEAIHVELRGAEPSGLPPSAPSGADAAGGQPADPSQPEDLGERTAMPQPVDHAESFVLEAVLQPEPHIDTGADSPDHDARRAEPASGGAQHPGAGRHPQESRNLGPGATPTTGPARGTATVAEAARSTPGRIDRYA